MINGEQSSPEKVLPRYEQITMHSTYGDEGHETITVDAWPRYTAFSPYILGNAYPERLVTEITVTVDNGQATYRVIGFDGVALVAEKVEQ